MGLFGDGGAAARRQATIERVQQQAELDKQKLTAQNQAVSSLQDTLTRETNQVARIFGQRALLAGMPAAGRPR